MKGNEMKKIIAIILMLLAITGNSYAAGYGRHVQGTAQAANGAADATVIGAPNTGYAILVKSGVCAVEIAAVGGSGEFALENGVNGTRIFQDDADAVGHFSFNFGEEGYLLSPATLLNVTVDGAVTTQATASCSVVGEVVGS
jgi:hypothetical protein